MSARRFAIIVILALSFGSPIVEMFDQWDHTAQDGNDTEANIVITAVCVGLALLGGATIIVTRPRAQRGIRTLRTAGAGPTRTRSLAAPIPTGSPPPTALRI